jgi:hypothetical protein
MKKILILILPILLASCFWWDNDEVKKAKEELFSTWVEVETKDETSTNEINLEEASKYDKPFVEVNWEDANISIEQIENIENVVDQVEIKWNVSNKDIDKVVVSFSNELSKFPKDSHTLSQFKKWDTSFTYRAFKKYQVLDEWLNEYKIEAYVWSELVSTINIDINLPINTKENTETNSWTIQEESTSSWEVVMQTLWDENDVLTVSLPVDESSYWKPETLSNNTFNYSNIEGFVWEKDSWIFNVNCDNLAEYLSNKFTWFYWNTCRPVSWEDWIYANVLYLSWENYFYKRVYIDKKHWIYLEALLEEWTWVTKDDLQAKNTELKSATFDVLEKTDKLFTDLLK